MGSHAGPRGPIDEGVDRDLKALAARSHRNMKSLTDTIDGLAGGRPDGTREERRMASIRFFGARPRLAVVAAVAGLALALLVIPVSYQRVVGHEVTLDLAGSAVDQGTIRGVATEFKAALDADAVRVEAQAGENGVGYTLAARVPARNGRSARAVAEAFAHTLNGKGYTAQASVSPVREKVSSNVYAMVAENVIQVSVDGKNAAEVEAEIAAQLAAAGIPDAQVSVTVDEDGSRIQIEVRAECDAPADPCVAAPEIVLTAGGEDLAGEVSDAKVQIRKTMSEAGSSLVIDLEQGDRTGTVTVDRPETLSDTELLAEIQRQLAALGMTDLSVSVENGIVRCFDTDALLTKSAPTATPGGAEQSSFGKVKSKYNR